MRQNKNVLGKKRWGKFLRRTIAIFVLVVFVAISFFSALLQVKVFAASVGCEASKKESGVQECNILVKDFAIPPSDLNVKYENNNVTLSWLQPKAQQKVWFYIPVETEQNLDTCSSTNIYSRACNMGVYEFNGYKIYVKSPTDKNWREIGSQSKISTTSINYLLPKITKDTTYSFKVTSSYKHTSNKFDGVDASNNNPRQEHSGSIEVSKTFTTDGITGDVPTEYRPILSVISGNNTPVTLQATPPKNHNPYEYLFFKRTPGHNWSSTPIKDIGPSTTLSGPQLYTDSDTANISIEEGKEAQIEYVVQANYANPSSIALSNTAVVTLTKKNGKIQVSKIDTSGQPPKTEEIWGQNIQPQSPSAQGKTSECQSNCESNKKVNCPDWRDPVKKYTCEAGCMISCAVADTIDWFAGTFVGILTGEAIIKWITGNTDGSGD